MVATDDLTRSRYRERNGHTEVSVFRGKTRSYDNCNRRIRRKQARFKILRSSAVADT